ALLVVGDGRKARFFRNTGSLLHPKLTVERSFEHESLPTRDLGTDRPGRAVAEPGGPRSAIEQTDWHQLEEDRFVHSVAESLSRAVTAYPSIRVVVVMPPKALGNFREALNAQVRKSVVAEIPQDLTGHPVAEIERRFTANP
ncbi:MAG: Host attachment protein, partial [Gammaproteobacteria bacterium]|nr:Host attachment protein [Gammaproteobacteria bacterium]